VSLRYLLVFERGVNIYVLSFRAVCIGLAPIKIQQVQSTSRFNSTLVAM